MTIHECRLFARAQTLLRFDEASISERRDPPENGRNLADVVELLLCKVEELTGRVKDLEGRSDD